MGKQFDEDYDVTQYDVTDYHEEMLIIDTERAKSKNPLISAETSLWSSIVGLAIGLAWIIGYIACSLVVATFGLGIALFFQLSFWVFVGWGTGESNKS
jgi:hypothetical protein